VFGQDDGTYASPIAPTRPIRMSLRRSALWAAQQAMLALRVGILLSLLTLLQVLCQFWLPSCRLSRT